MVDRTAAAGNLSLFAALAALAILATVAIPCAATDTRNVLVLYSNNRLVPGNVAVDRGLREAMVVPGGPLVQTFSEFLDRPDFGGEDYEAAVTRYLREKYSTRRPHAIVAVSDSSLVFLLRHRTEMFPGVPVIHAAVANSLLQTLRPLPGDVLGIPIEYDYVGTIDQALRWHPGVRRLLVITGTSERDREREARLRREVPAAAGGVPVEFLTGLPTAALLKRLGELDKHDVVFTPGYFEDGNGQLTNPRDSAALMAVASTAPVYGPVDTFIGTGVVGGRMPSFEDMGHQAGRMVSQLFGGTAAPLELPAIMPTTLQVDWRQIERWGIDQRAIPAGTIVKFRSPSFWEAYRNVAIITAAVMLLQAAVIATLLLEHRRRRSAEMAMQAQRIELAHASRLAVAGELTASIAHEINQPLGAVQTSADAADLLLQAGGDRREELVRIVTRIRRDTQRASDVIRRLRALLARHEPLRQSFSLAATVSEVDNLLSPEARRRRVSLLQLPVEPDIAVSGDQTQLQQVLINLVLNAMDAVSELPEGRRSVEISIGQRAAEFTITVRDNGHGIAAEHLPKVFDSFFSTKQKGMGLGLSIARTIVEAHGGSIRATSVIGEGARFEVTLPRTDLAVSSGTATR